MPKRNMANKNAWFKNVAFGYVSITVKPKELGTTETFLSRCNDDEKKKPVRCGKNCTVSTKSCIILGFPGMHTFPYLWIDFPWQSRLNI